MSGPVAIDERLLEALSRLRVLPARAGSSRMEGARPSGRPGPGIEFADWRPYAAGDSPREIDWRAFARLGRAFVRLRTREEATTVCLLVDASASMAFGRPAKFAFAARVAAALAAAALAGLDAVLTGFLRGSACELAEAVTGSDALATLLGFLGRAEASGRTDLAGALANFLDEAPGRLASSGTGGGVLIVISDFWSESALEDSLGAAAEAGFEGALIQVLEPEEAEPRLGGRTRLADSETGLELELEISAAVREAYVRERERFQEELSACAATRGFRTAALTSDMPLERAVLGELRAAGVLG